MSLLKKGFRFLVQSKSTPVITIDNEAIATYVKFGDGKIVQTSETHCDLGGVITVDLDRHTHVVGVEAIGGREISLQNLLQKTKVEAPKVNLSEVRFSHFVGAVS
jgi:uncharacterized protein YuzE